MEAGKHPREDERLRELRSFGILDTERESEFDEIVNLAAGICGTPISVVNMIDAHRQWFKAEVGLGVRETPLATSICSHVILEDDYVEIPDTLKDPRMADNPLCNSEPHLRFYAGALLKTPEGLPLGTLCVLDKKPRRLSDQQQTALKLLAKQAMTQLQFRRALTREAKARQDLQIVSDHVPVMIVRVDAERRYSYANGRYADFFGRTSEEMVGRHPSDVLRPKIYAKVGPKLERAFSGEAFDYDLEIETADGETRILNVAYEPERADDGTVNGVIAAIDDVTEHRAAERKIAQNAQRLRRILDGLHCFVSTLTADGVRTEVNARAVQTGGASRDDLIGHLFWDGPWWGHSPEVQDRLRDAVARAAGGETVRFDAEARTVDGQTIILDLQIGPVFDDDGSLIELIASGVDITERKEAEEHRGLLLNELKHRVKNSLATIQAIASQTARSASGTDAFLEAFQGRLNAIAKAHDILSGEGGVRAKLRDLIVEQVGPYAEVDTDRCLLDGPDIVLGTDAAHALGLVLHELATNAAKYGALSGEGGSIALHWRKTEDDGDEAAVIEWVESGGPPVRPPQRQGFGSRMIEASLVRGLKGEAELHYEPDGFRAMLKVPL